LQWDKLCCLVFFQDLFKTKINPNIAPLDLDEVVVWIQAWYVALLEQAIKNSATQRPDNTFFDYFIQFPYTAQQFRIAVRQAVLGIFIQSQAATQFITYSTSNNGFEPFRVGSNCFSRNRFQMLMPTLLVENLRMLMPRFISYNSKIPRDHNQQILCPVWGVYRGLDRIPPNTMGMFSNGEGELVPLPMFEDNFGPNDPNIIDGTNDNSLCCDLNSPIVEEIILDWNERINELQLFSSPTTYLGGTSTATLLTLSRYCKYAAQDNGVPLSKMSRLQKTYKTRIYSYSYFTSHSIS